LIKKVKRVGHGYRKFDHLASRSCHCAVVRLIRRSPRSSPAADARYGPVAGGMVERPDRLPYSIGYPVR
jgi:hypothetical protein